VPTVADLLEVRGIAVNYGDAQAVRDVSLSVRAGQITALIGSNGAGKTTTLHAIAGLLPVRAGTITLADQDVTHRSAPEMPALGLSLVQQGKRIFPGMTVEANLLVATYPHKLRKAARHDLIAEAYERFPILRDKKNAAAGSLSGGQQQMLAIGQSLMARPKVLMLDEPSAGLAPAIVKEVLRTVVSLAGDGLGILVVEQLVEDALAIAHDVVVLDEGTVSIAGDVATVSRDPRLMDAYLGPRL
jgi:branched-chain amino acid transport system ATP-binding protein